MHYLEDSPLFSVDGPNLENLHAKCAFLLEDAYIYIPSKSSDAFLLPGPVEPPLDQDSYGANIDEHICLVVFASYILSLFTYK